MKVDLGACALCGAKNSKFVETCYKCGAPLPWAPNYAAVNPPHPPTPAPQKPAPRSAPQPVTPPVPPRPVAPPAPQAQKTVVPPVMESSPFDNFPAKPSPFDFLTRTIPLPVWGVGLTIVGCTGLGMLLATALGGKPQVVQVVATPVPTDVVLAPTAVPAVVVPTLVPDPAPTVAPTVAVVPTEVPTPLVQIKAGPTFDDVDQKMDDRGNAWTEAQKQAYWQSVAGSTVTWTGVVVELRLTNGGQVTMTCGPQTLTSDVMATLDGTQQQLLPQINKGQRIKIQGILQDHSSSGYQISQAKILEIG